MKEFMLLIRNEFDHQDSWPSDRHTQFVQQCEQYIGKLKKEGKLLAAQPLVREGVIVGGTRGAWNSTPFNESKEVQVGYYHIRAKDIDEAVDIAKENPEFAFSTTARIEVRPVKTKEDATHFTYPGQH